MRRDLKLFLIGSGVVLKLFGVPQKAQCPTYPEYNGIERKAIFTNSEINYSFDYYNTTNLKKVDKLYDLCND